MIVFLASLALAAYVLVMVAASIKVLRGEERGVVFRLGRPVGIKRPGLVMVIPFVDRMVRVEGDAAAEALFEDSRA